MAEHDADDAYYRYLRRKSGSPMLRDIKQLPYRWNLHRLQLGRVLDIGCGLGRHLRHAPRGVGVDIDPRMVEHCVAQGLKAHTDADFASSDDAAPGSYETLLFSHVLEHMTGEEAAALLRRYLPYLRKAGRVIAITPQEMGFRADPTHREFVDEQSMARIASEVGMKVQRWYSFPFPRWAGRFFAHNEFVCILVSV